jgi:hypothetical protein
MAPYDISKEKEIQVCVISWNNNGYSLWDEKGVTLVWYYLPRGTKVNSNHYTETLRNTEESKCSHL